MQQYINPLDEFKESIQSSDIISFIHNQFSQYPYSNLFIQNIDYFLNNTVEVEFKPEWEQNPFKTAFDIYGNKNFYHFLLLINSVPSIIYFTSDFLNSRLKIVSLNTLKDFIECNLAQF